MQKNEQAHVIAAAFSHPGMSGKKNEDRYAVSAYILDDGQGTPVFFGVLADGIGGHRAGEVAADLVVKRVTQIIAESSGKDPITDLVNAIHQTSQEIFIESLKDPSRQGMGATCAAAWIIGDHLYTATVGDSRIYMLRDGVIHQLSIDHTWIQEALDLGLIQADQVANHPNAHVIRRYLGAPNPPRVDSRMRLSRDESDNESENNQKFLLKPGDHVVLCSDGLTDLVEDKEILDAFMNQPVQQAIQNLTDLANERGGHDNITIIGIQVPPKFDSSKQRKPGWKVIGCMLLVVLLFLAALLVIVARMPGLVR